MLDFISIQMDSIAFPFRVLLAALLFVSSFQMCHSDPNQPVLKAELVAPGIWRVRLGKPEEFTPSFFRTAPEDR